MTKSYAIQIDYNTQGGTAISPGDYTHTSGTATISPNTNSTTVNVPTTAGSTSGLSYFNFYLNNPINATIANNYPTGTIIPTSTAASAEWYMDETSWNNTANEVRDISGNTNHGTPKNSITTIDTSKILCSAGSFDGFDDYIEVPDSANINGSSDLTYSVWINPNSWTLFGSSVRRQIMGKSLHLTNAQIGIFVDGGVLKGRAETSAGQYEVSTSLPALNTWTHVALVFSTNELRLYINGNVAAAKSFNATTLIQTTNPLMIGRSNQTTGSLNWASNFDGLIDETIVFKETLPASFISQMYTNYTNALNWDGTTRSCHGAAIDHIEFIHDGSALTCNPEHIIIKACADNAVPCAPYTSAVTMDLLPTGWLGGDSKTFTSVTGSANYDLQYTTIGQVTLTGSNVSPVSTEVICRNFASGPAIACTMDFNDSGFIFDVTTQTSCVTSSNIKISAVRKNPTTEKCINFTPLNPTPTLKFRAAYSNPSTGTKQATLNYNNTDYPLATSTPDTDITMDFDANGEATFTLNYPDAGELDLRATYTGSVATSDFGLSMSGNQIYLTKPAKFYIYSDDTNTSCPSADPTNADCNPAFRKTGENFNLKIRAACDNADNTITPNFQLDGMTISSNLIAPISAGSVNANPSISLFNISDADNGEHIISNQNIDNVGVFTFTASLPASGYLNETVIGSTALNTSANIGRFTPDHFDTQVTHGCSGGGNFTYSGQTFTVTAFSRNQNNATTVNYRDSFAFGVTLSDLTSTSNFTNNTISSASFSSATAGNGSSAGVGAQSNTIYTFANKETIPNILDIRATDQNNTAGTSIDDITSNGFTEGTTEIRSGRTRIENSYGSELVDMAVTAQVEYFNTNGFEINNNDFCSVITATLADIGTDTVTVGDGSTEGQACIWDDDAESGAYNCSDASVLPGPVSSQFEKPPIAGSFNLFLHAPGATYTGNIGITLNSPTWLKYDWDGDGSHDNDPNGVASFGLYRGDDRIIYWREVF